MKTKEDVNVFIKMFNVSIFVLLMGVLGVLSAITYVYSVVKVCNIINFGAGAFDFSKFISIVGVFSFFAIIAIILVVLGLVIYKYIKNRLVTDIRLDNIVYFVYNKRFIDAIIFAVVAVLVFFPVKMLMMYLIPWLNSILFGCMFGGFLVNFAYTLVCYFVSLIVLNKQSKTFKKQHYQIYEEIKQRRSDRVKYLKNKNKVENTDKNENVVNVENNQANKDTANSQEIDSDNKTEEK